MRTFNDIYSKSPTPYGWDPSSWVVKIKKYAPLPATVLDLGVCYGRNAIFLAKEGYVVEGVDISKVALNVLETESKKQNVFIHSYNEDIANFQFRKYYDVIISNASLHYLKNVDVVKSVVERMKSHTNVGGLNIISAPTETKKAMDFPIYFKKNQFKEYYSDWDILDFGEQKDLFTNGDIGTIAYIIARKK